MDSKKTGGSTDFGAELRMGMGAFEMQRMLRQNAHEKAFEIRVLEQRAFEKQKEEMIVAGNQKAQDEYEEKVKNCERNYNIANSRSIHRKVRVLQKATDNLGVSRERRQSPPVHLATVHRRRLCPPLEDAQCPPCRVLLPALRPAQESRDQVGC